MTIIQDFKTVTFNVLLVYKPTFSVVFCIEWKARAFQVSSIVFSSYTFPQPNLIVWYTGVYWHEDKQTRNLESCHPANFDVSEIYEGNIQSWCHLAQLFLDSLAVILRKRAKSLEKFFSSSGNAICSILLRYQEICVQIQTFTDEHWNNLHSCSFDGTNCQFVDYKYWKYGHYTFILDQP